MEYIVLLGSKTLNKTWRMKLECLWNTANYLDSIHHVGSVHCDLHGRNILLHGNDLEFDPYEICKFNF